LKHYENIANTFDPGKKPKQEALEEGFIKIIEYAEKTRLPPMANGQEKKCITGMSPLHRPLNGSASRTLCAVFTFLLL
ncbi:MAG: hypothetical protein LBK08_00745, partial [Treponema sp.]|nr:hypothetical protein [Treponema sp.]